jgi:hypothetical protein
MPFPGNYRSIGTPQKKLHNALRAESRKNARQWRQPVGHKNGGLHALRTIAPDNPAASAAQSRSAPVLWAVPGAAVLRARHRRADVIFLTRSFPLLRSSRYVPPGGATTSKRSA